MTTPEQLRADRLAKLNRTQMTPRLMGRAELTDNVAAALGYTATADQLDAGDPATPRPAAECNRCGTSHKFGACDPAARRLRSRPSMSEPLDDMRRNRP